MNHQYTEQLTNPKYKDKIYQLYRNVKVNRQGVEGFEK